ncbi:MAG: hypothetical protein WCR55_09850 [Lentisphaerota bacterium]
MKYFVGCLVVFIYFGIGAVQAVAFLQGLMYFYDLSFWKAAIISIPLSFIPIAGTVLGIIGAVKVWDFSYFWAIILFCWPYLIYVLIIFIAVVIPKKKKAHF